MRLLDLLNLIALAVIPLAAVLIGRWLQERSEKRKDKLQVFKAVMTFRYGWSRESVEALNSIPVVFSGKNKDAQVRKLWKSYYEYLCIQNPNDIQIKQRNNALFKLLESMAEVLGYKNRITWEDIQNPYIPLGMVAANNNYEIIQSGMASIVQGMLQNSQEVSNFNTKKDKEE